MQKEIFLAGLLCTARGTPTRLLGSLPGMRGVGQPASGPGAVRGVRPGFQDVRPGNRDAPAISQRHGVGGCPLARRKGNVVSYTLLQKRRSQKQRLKRRSASRALCWTHEKDARLFVAARVMAQHRPVRRLMPMMHLRGKLPPSNPSLSLLSSTVTDPDGLQRWDLDGNMQN